MLNVPESIKILYQTDGINKNFRVHFPNGENADLTNKDIVEGSVKFAESVSSKDVLKFGLSEQSKIEFECVGVQNIFGMTIECSNEIDISSLTAEEIEEIQDGEWDGTLVLAGDSDIDYGYFRIPLGTFVVSSCPRSHGAMAHRRVVGYSNLFTEEYEQYDALFYVSTPFKNINVDLCLLKFLISKENMTTTNNVIREETVTSANFYDSSGNRVNISVYGTVYSVGVGTLSNVIEVSMSGNLSAYEQNGVAIAKAIGDADVDVLYDVKKNKSFSTTEEAIRTKMPELFSPAIVMEYLEYKSDPSISATSDYIIKPRNGINVIPTNTGPLINCVMGIGLSEYEQISVNRFYTYAPVGNDTRVEVWFYNKNDELVRTETIVYEMTPYNFVLHEVKSFKPTALTGVKFLLNPSLKSQGKYFDVGNLEADYKDRAYTKYTYQNSISIPELVKGLLELSAEFGRVGRTGNEIKKLSKQNPVSIEPSDVEELWWDEYDVEQIGTVRYNIADTQSVVEYQISNGGSVYDFGNNYFIKRIFASYTEDNYIDAINLINSLIDQYFVPNIVDVPFVPVDMTMRGLPYVESGDYIVYDDGTDQVGTYVLSREMEDVQSLFDEVESNGGEVLGN